MQARLDIHSSQVGTLKGGLCRPCIVPLPLYEHYMSLIWGYLPGSYLSGDVLDFWS